MTVKVKNILVSQPKPADLDKSPYGELSKRHNLDIDFYKFITNPYSFIRRTKTNSWKTKYPFIRNKKVRINLSAKVEGFGGIEKEYFTKSV